MDKRVRLLGHIFTVGDGNRFTFSHSFIVGEADQSASSEQQIDEEIGFMDY